MSNSQELSWMERNNLTPGKIGLIAVLSVIFVSVVAYQLAPIVFRGGPAPPPVANQTRPKSRAARAAAAAPSQPIPPPPPQAAAGQVSNHLTKRTDAVWPQIALEDATRHDPFALPSSLRHALRRQRQLAARNQAHDDAPDLDEAIARREQFLALLSERGVDVVIFEGEKAVAAVGELEFRVGDVVEGLLVKSISRNGIELVRVEPEDKDGEP